MSIFTRLRRSAKRLLAVWHARNLEFVRDRSSLIFTLGLPVAIVVAMALIFGGPPRPLFKVGVLGAIPATASYPFLGERYFQFVSEPEEAAGIHAVARSDLDLLLDLRRHPVRFWVIEDSPKGYVAEKLLLQADPLAQRQATVGAASRYIDWLFPGVLGMNMMFTCLTGAGYVVLRYRKNGFLKRLSATPVSAFEFLSAQVLSRLGLAMAVTLILYVGVGSVIHFHNVGSNALLLLVAILGCLSLIAFGLIIAARFASEEVVGGLLNLLMWPMMLLSGIWFSLEGSPRWMQLLAQLFPLTHILQAVRAITLDGAGLATVGIDLAYLAGTTLVFLALGALFLSVESRMTLEVSTHAFYSDNTASVAPQLLEALRQANDGPQKAYGDDPWTLQLDATFSEFFGTPVRAFVVTTGTAANALSLATLSPPYGNVFAHTVAHVVEDECGAVEFYSGGARLTLVAGEHGRLDPQALEAAIEAHPANVHTVQPAAVTLTQATELGTTYTPGAVAALSAVARRHGLRVHMDGARLANAIDFLDCHPGDVTWRAGVDVLSFGATKNGALAAEAVVFFDTTLVRDFELRRKRAGHLLSKSRYAAAQLLAYLEGGVWRAHARRANRFAQRIAAAAGSRLTHPVEANELFIDLGVAGKAALRAQGFGFYDWGPAAGPEARFVVSWDQTEASVEALCAAFT